MLAFHAAAATIYHAARELRYVVARTHTHVFGSKQVTYGFALMATKVDSTICTCITKAYAVRGSYSSSSLTARASGEAPSAPAILLSLC